MFFGAGAEKSQSEETEGKSFSTKNVIMGNVGVISTPTEKLPPKLTFIFCRLGICNMGGIAMRCGWVCNSYCFLLTLLCYQICDLFCM